MTSKIFLSSFAALLTSVHGEFVLIDDFETLTPGPLSGQNGWTADVDYTVADDPAGGGNRVLQYLFGAQGGAFRPLGDLAVNDGETSTLFFRFRFSEDGNGNTGFSDVAAPSAYPDFESQVNRQESTALKGRDGAGFQDLGYSDPPVVADEVEVWYSIWVVADNLNDTSRMFLQSNDDPDFAVQTEVFVPDGTINFRNGTGLPLTTLMLRAQRGTVYWDDIYVSDGEDLSNPAPSSGAGDGIQITDFSYRGGDSLELTWTSVSGHEYAIETSANLNDWIALSETVIADTSLASAELFDDDIAPVGGRLFFRIQDLGIPAE